MRRIASVTVVLVLSLAACSTEVSADSSTVGSSPATGATAEPTPTPTPTATATESATPSVDVEIPAGFAIANEKRRDLPRYQRFRYQTATATGLAPEAAAAVDASVSSLVTATVDRAVRKGEDDCLVGRGRCASFEATLTPLPCRDGFLCLLQEVTALWPASAIPYRTADTLVFDVSTGRQVALTDVVPTAQLPGFLRSVREAVDRFQRKHGVTRDDLPEQLAASDIQAWAPLPRGIRVWFDEYAAAPGFYGVVSVRVPSSS